MRTSKATTVTYDANDLYQTIAAWVDIAYPTLTKEEIIMQLSKIGDFAFGAQDIPPANTHLSLLQLCYKQKQEVQIHEQH